MKFNFHYKNNLKLTITENKLQPPGKSIHPLTYEATALEKRSRDIGICLDYYDSQAQEDIALDKEDNFLVLTFIHLVLQYYKKSCYMLVHIR